MGVIYSMIKNLATQGKAVLLVDQSIKRVIRRPRLSDQARNVAPIVSIIAKSAADIRLAAGEGAVQEGDECAFYAVISGKIEVIRLKAGSARSCTRSP